MIIPIEDFAEDYNHLNHKSEYLKLLGFQVEIEATGDGRQIIILSYPVGGIV